jgi:hypothetical protein
LAQQVNRIADVAGSKNTKCFGHDPLWLEVLNDHTSLQMLKAGKGENERCESQSAAV